MAPDREARVGSAPSSQTTCSARPLVGRAPAPSQIRVIPQASARLSSSAVAGSSTALTASRTSPGRARRRTAAMVRPLPDDDRVDEFDRDVPAVCRPLRCDAPHGRPGGESPGQ